MDVSLGDCGLAYFANTYDAEENQNEPTVQEENDPPAESPETDDPEIPKDEENKPAQRTGITKTSRLTMDR